MNLKHLIFFLVLTSVFSLVGKAQDNYAFIDRAVRLVDAPSPDSLSKALSKNFNSELDKVRAIYSWIGQNISYNTAIFTKGRGYDRRPVLQEPEDSTTWGSGHEMTAKRVLKRRMAICDGYAKLFKTLCEYSGIASEVITGYSRSDFDSEMKFRTNHSWNAVRIDSQWHLLDVTWGAGYVGHTNEFIQKLDDRYFLPDPADFVTDHYPEDLSWTLLDHPPTLKEYRKTPFKFKTFVKYNIAAHFPASGIIVASLGDTILVEMNLADIKRARSISPDPFLDTAIAERNLNAIFLSPSEQKGNKVYYRYVVVDPAKPWLHILYNDDLILRYRINLKKNPGVFPLAALTD
jgi:hypothetical protein